jgi:hypothetical protein
MRESRRARRPSTRCPYCHDELLRRGGWVACVDCLARHHQACWAEGAGCGTCGGRLGAAPERPRGKRRVGPLLALAALGALAVAGLAALSPRADERDDDLDAWERAVEQEAELTLAAWVAREEARSDVLRAEIRVLEARLESEVQRLGWLEEVAARAGPPSRTGSCFLDRGGGAADHVHGLPRCLGAGR